jgi:hypothetical protein
MSQETNKPSQRRIEPLRAEPLPAVPESKPRASKLRKFLGKAALAGLFIVPTADLMLSDAVTVKAYEVTQDKIDMSSETAEKAAEAGIIGGLIVAESVALGQAVTRSKKAKNAFSDFDAYLESDEKLAKVLTAPFAGFKKLGNAFERLGEKASARKSKIARSVGHMAVDAGHINMVGTTGVIMQEDMAGNTPNLKRQTYLGGLIAGSWVGAAEGVRQLYRNVAPLRPPMAAIGNVYEALTTVSLSNPLETPVGSLTMGAIASGLAYSGWKIEEFRHRRDEQLGVDHAQLQQAISEFQHPQD